MLDLILDAAIAPSPDVSTSASELVNVIGASPAPSPGTAPSADASPAGSPAPQRRFAATADMARLAAAATPSSGLHPSLSGPTGTTSGRSRSLYQSMRLSPPALDKFMAHPEVSWDGSVESQGSTTSQPDDAAAGATVPSPTAPTMAKGDAGDLFVGRIRSALARLKIDEGQAQLLAQVYAMPEHARQMASSSGDKRGRGRDGDGSGDAAVAAVEATMLGLDLGGRFDALADIISSVINRVTGAQPVVDATAPAATADDAAAAPLLPNGLIIAVDDAQWLDTMSWSLLGYIARRCPRVMLVIALRRFGRTSSDSLLRIESMPDCTTITLSGLSPMGVSNLVAHIYGENVTSVHERLLDKCVGATGPLACQPNTNGVRARARARGRRRNAQNSLSIMSKTGGNPLFVEHMAVAMKGQRYLAVSGTGELFFKPKQNASELDALFPRDLQSAMLVQFDRLPADLQLILRVASVIGQVSRCGPSCGGGACGLAGERKAGEGGPFKRRLTPKTLREAAGRVRVDQFLCCCFLGCRTLTSRSWPS